MIKFEEYVKKIKEYLNNKPKIVTGEECSNFYIDIEDNCPYYNIPYDQLTLEQKKKDNFVDEVREICEMTEPFSMCEKEDKLLLELMKKYGYM